MDCDHIASDATRACGKLQRFGSESDWTYISEGNAALAIRLQGSTHGIPSTHIMKKVLRLVKAPVPDARLSHVDHILGVCSELYGPQYFPNVVGGVVDKVIADRIISKYSRRPHRAVLAETRRSLFNHYTLSADLTSLWLPLSSVRFLDQSCVLNRDACLAIEIKPKCGFIPSSYLVSPQYRHLKCKLSRFECMQKFKGRSIFSVDACGEVRQQDKFRSIGYSPSDFFSQSHEKICLALKALIDQPFNYFKAFTAGNFLSYDAKTGLSFQSALTDACAEMLNITYDTLIDTLSNIIRRESLFQNILSIQKLDILDVEGAYLIYQRLLSLVYNDRKKVEQLMKQYLINGKGWEHNLDACMKFVERFKDILYTEGTPNVDPTSPSLAFSTAEDVIKNMSAADCAVLLSYWFLSQAASDCSVMVSMRTLDRNFVHVSQQDALQTLVSAGVFSAGGRCIVYCVGVLDVGPKPFDQVEKKRRTEAKLWDYISQLEGKQVYCNES